MNEDATPVPPTEPATQTWGRWGDRLAAMIADQKAIFAARKAKEAQASDPTRAAVADKVATDTRHHNPSAETKK